MINEKRKQIFLDPTRENIDNLIMAFKDLNPVVFNSDIAFLDALQPLGRTVRPNHAPIKAIAPKANNKNKKAKPKESNAASPMQALVSVKVPASAQWSFVNGLGDMEWIQGRCVRRCMEEMVVHAQALPIPKVFEISITGRFEKIPNAQVRTPFHSMIYRVETADSTEKSEWTCHTYQCQLESEHDEYGHKEILFEFLFSVSDGDYILDLVYSF